MITLTTLTQTVDIYQWNSRTVSSPSYKHPTAPVSGVLLAVSNIFLEIKYFIIFQQNFQKSFIHSYTGQ